MSNMMKTQKRLKEKKVCVITGPEATILKKYLIDFPEGEADCLTWKDGSVNGQDINSLEDLSKVLANTSGPVRVEGIYPGYDGTYTYPLNLE